MHLPAHSFASTAHGIRVPNELGLNGCLITRIHGVGFTIPHMGLDDASAPPTSICFEGQEYLRAAMRPAGSPSASRIVPPQSGGGQVGEEVDPGEEVLGDVDDVLAGTEVRLFSGHWEDQILPINPSLHSPDKRIARITMSTLGTGFCHLHSTTFRVLVL